MDVDVQTHNMFVLLALFAMTFIGALAWKKECDCGKCAFHANEKRMKRLKAQEESERYSKDQANLRHDYEHKGGGWRTGDPDRFNCADDTCPRNPRKSKLDT